MKKVFLSMMALVMLFSRCTVLAEGNDISTMTDDELNALHVQVHDEITRRCVSDSELNYPTYNGTDPVLVYEDEYVMIHYRGFYQWTDSWYIPMLNVTNKTDEELEFDWDAVYLNRNKMGAANGGGGTMMANGGKYSLASDKRCSITMSDYEEIYWEDHIYLLELTFTVYDSNNKRVIDDAKLGVFVDFDIH